MEYKNNFSDSLKKTIDKKRFTKTLRNMIEMAKTLSLDDFDNELEVMDSLEASSVSCITIEDDLKSFKHLNSIEYNLDTIIYCDENQEINILDQTIDVDSNAKHIIPIVLAKSELILNDVCRNIGINEIF